MPIDQDTVLRTLLRDRSRLLAYIAVILPDEHLAEDIFQDVSLLAVRKHAEIESEAHLLAWLRQAARTSALQARRNTGRRPLLLLNAAALDTLEQYWTEQDGVDNQARVDILRKCLEKLAPYPRQLIDLRYGAGLSGNALADRVHRKLQTVYVALSRAHRTLSECLQRQLKAGEVVGA